MTEQLLNVVNAAFDFSTIDYFPEKNVFIVKPSVNIKD